jgi:hypothetical protein
MREIGHVIDGRRVAGRSAATDRQRPVRVMMRFVRRLRRAAFSIPAIE